MSLTLYPNVIHMTAGIKDVIDDDIDNDDDTMQKMSLFFFYIYTQYWIVEFHNYVDCRLVIISKVEPQYRLWTCVVSKYRKNNHAW